MNRTFTLRRLLLNVALFALIAAAIAAFPIQSIRVALTSSIFVPAIAISVFFVYCSRHPKTVLLVSLMGAALGWLLSPKLFVIWASPPTWWDLYLIDLQTQLLPTTIGAVALGALALSVSSLQRPKRQHV